MIRLVDNAAWPPAECAITKLTNGPFIDTGVNFRHRDGRVYLKIQAVQECAEVAGLFNEYREELKASARQIADLEQQLQEADRLVESAEVALHNFEKRPTRIPVTQSKE